MSSSSPLADLFAAAREDAPSDVVHDEVWGRVAAATAAPAAVVAGKALSLPSAGKLLTLGAVIGVVSTVATAFAIGAFDGDLRPPARVRPPVTVAHGVTAGARLADPTPRARAESTPPPAVETPKPAPPPAPARSEASTLEEEARLVSEMRAALLRGDADQALALSRTIDRLPARALEPEELGLQLRALRALGRTDEALAVELTLRRRFPEHALSK